MIRKCVSLIVLICLSLIAVRDGIAAETDVIETIAAAGNFKTLTSAIKAADLVDMLKEKGPYTVFAPTDEAFEKLPAGVLQDLLKPENKQKLATLLKHHVVPEKLTASELSHMKHVKSAAGAEIAVTAADGKLMLDRAHVTKSDISCTNGVIHILDAVLETSPAKSGEPVAAAQSAELPYLGLGVEPLHRAFVGHLLHALGKGRGVLVFGVTKDSPAEKMGVHRDDIIVSYDDQHIYSPDQLIKLIHADKSGREVKLGIVRAGKTETLQGILGHQRPMAAAGRQRGGSVLTSERAQHPSAEEQQTRWRSFDSLNLARIGEGRFKAEIKYRANDGKTESKTFEGSRDQLREKIDAQQDLPMNERRHLLRALDMLREDMAAESAGTAQAPGERVTWDLYEIER